MATPNHLIATTNCNMATMNHPTVATVRLVTVTHRHLIADDDYPMAALADRNDHRLPIMTNRVIIGG